MSALTAGAQSCVGRTIDDHVPAFAAVAVLAVEAKVADDNSAADARAQREQHHAVEIAAGADPKFAVSGRVGVVGKSDRQAAMVAHPVAQWKIVPAFEVGRFQELCRREYPWCRANQALRGRYRKSQFPPCSAICKAALPIRTAGVFRPFRDIGGDAQPGQRPTKIVDYAHLDIGSS